MLIKVNGKILFIVIMPSLCSLGVCSIKNEKKNPKELPDRVFSHVKSYINSRRGATIAVYQQRE